MKVDSGPGRIVANEESIKKREEFMEKGLYILLGLPNATAVQQEMDALYGAFKSATYARGEAILTQKLKERGAWRETVAYQDPTTGARAGLGPAITLGFDDLAVIVNGSEDDAIAMKPFDKCFTKENILRSWQKVGFVPFTRSCMTDKKVRHELGQQDKNDSIESLKKGYDNLVELTRQHGFNAGVFDASIPMAARLKRVLDEEEQVKELVERKGAFSTTGLWNVCGSRIGNSGVALRAQKAQLALDASRMASLSQAKKDRHAKHLVNAQQRGLCL